MKRLCESKLEWFEIISNSQPRKWLKEMAKMETEEERELASSRSEPLHPSFPVPRNERWFETEWFDRLIYAAIVVAALFGWAMALYTTYRG